MASQLGQCPILILQLAAREPRHSTGASGTPTQYWSWENRSLLVYMMCAALLGVRMAIPCDRRMSREVQPSHKALLRQRAIPYGGHAVPAGGDSPPRAVPRVAKTVGAARAAFGPCGWCRPRRGRARENPVPGEHGEENEYSEWLATRSPQLDWCCA